MMVLDELPRESGRKHVFIQIDKIQDCSAHSRRPSTTFQKNVYINILIYRLYVHKLLFIDYFIDNILFTSVSRLKSKFFLNSYSRDHLINILYDPLPSSKPRNSRRRGTPGVKSVTPAPQRRAVNLFIILAFLTVRRTPRRRISVRGCGADDLIPAERQGRR